MTADETRDALADVLAETRGLMERSANQTRRSFDHRAAVARLTRIAEQPTQPARLALPAPARDPEPTVFDLSSVSPFTERALATITGVSLAQIAAAIERKSIRVIRRHRKRRLLDVASTAMWLTHCHGIDPTVLLDINEEE